MASSPTSPTRTPTLTSPAQEATTQTPTTFAQATSAAKDTPTAVTMATAGITMATALQMVDAAMTAKMARVLATDSILRLFYFSLCFSMFDDEILDIYCNWMHKQVQI